MSESPRTSLRSVRELKLYFPVTNKDWRDIYFYCLRIEGHYSAEQITALEQELNDSMPEPDEGWNAFDEAKAEALQQSEQFPDICKDQLKLGPLTYTCRRTHMAGDREHEVLSHDENGRQIRITWGRI